MRRFFWISPIVLVVAALVVGVVILLVNPFSDDPSGDGADGDGESPLAQALRLMVLDPEDLPIGLLRGDESFTTNDMLAAASADPEARKATIEGWGRLLGFELTYQPTGETLGQIPVQGINISASLYRTSEGASDSFAEAVETSEETDWAANYAGLLDFQQENLEADGVVDEMVWLRLSGLQPATEGPNALVTDDLIFFRVGRERGFLRVLASTTETEDRAHYQDTVEGWLRALVQNVRDVLAEEGLEAELEIEGE